jgi:hypothetical protein
VSKFDDKRAAAWSEWTIALDDRRRNLVAPCGDYRRYMYRRIAAFAVAVVSTVLVATADETGPNGIERPAELLFRSGFEGEVELGPLRPFGDGAWQEITGTDGESGFTWPPSIWDGTAALQLIAGMESVHEPADLPARMSNDFEFVTGPGGNRTRALRQIVRVGTGGVDENWSTTQNDLVLMPGPEGQGDLYIAYSLKLQGDLLERLTVDPWNHGERRVISTLLPRQVEQALDNPWAARVLSDWKTGGGNESGDYRILLSIHGDRDSRRVYWSLRGDNVANGGLPEQVFWEEINSTVRVPVGRWFRVEVFVHRSDGKDGRVLVAIDGTVLFDHYGPNFGIHRLPWSRIMPFLNYSTGQQLPAEQWVDDFEIWNGLPETATAAR